jgi:hypothetical protein
MSSLQYHGGPLLTRVEIVCIYLNVIIDATPTSDWHDLTVQTSDKLLSDCLDDFLDDITNSEYADMLTQYSTTDTNGIYYHILRGKRVGSYFLTAGPFNQSSTVGYLPDTTEIASFSANNWAHLVPWLNKAIQNCSLPPPHPDLCYLVFTPPGVNLDGISGAHNNFTFPTKDQVHSPSTVHYAVIAHPNSLQPHIVQSTPMQFNELTITISHELVEVITDPESHTGWSSIQSDTVKFEGEEIADLCAMRSFSFHGYQVSSFWSEQQQQCAGCEVQIHLEKNVGAGKVLASQVAHFSVDDPCIAKENLTYHWTVSSNATPIGGEAQSDFFVITPPAPNTMTVTVKVTAINSREAQISIGATYQSIASVSSDEII